MAPTGKNAVKVARLRGMTVVHTFICTTPGWYVEQVAGVVRQSADFSRCRVVITEADLLEN